MATFYVLSPAHVTFYKYAVEASTLDEARAKFDEAGSDHDDVEYAGYVDGDWEGGPENDWSDPDNSYVEGVG